MPRVLIKDRVSLSMQGAAKLLAETVGGERHMDPERGLREGADDLELEGLKVR